MSLVGDLNSAGVNATSPFYVRTWSPGDGVTRYRFFTLRPGQGTSADPTSDYFGPENGDYTALGRKEALAYASGRGAHI